MVAYNFIHLSIKFLCLKEHLIYPLVLQLINIINLNLIYNSAFSQIYISKLDLSP